MSAGTGAAAPAAAGGLPWAPVVDGGDVGVVAAAVSGGLASDSGSVDGAADGSCPGAEEVVCSDAGVVDDVGSAGSDTGGPGAVCEATTDESSSWPAPRTVRIAPTSSAAAAATLAAGRPADAQPRRAQPRTTARWVWLRWAGARREERGAPPTPASTCRDKTSFIVGAGSSSRLACIQAVSSTTGARSSRPGGCTPLMMCSTSRSLRSLTLSKVNATLRAWDTPEREGRALGAR